ncbi:hypothetical protein JG687_00002555 [Phytophthora cactorum]|uniref:FH2 domain-containing protein n=1 Tax=Phytophthora cactorum TaxID=29920 RepID=A0A8T1UY29_9STRA|nr:hypothetical protein JG687_00002555 [Phytophthora cactorum]
MHAWKNKMQPNVETNLCLFIQIPQAPAEDQVQLRFDELLLSACTDPEIRDELNAAESIGSKWVSKLPQGSVAEEWLDPRECVELVQRFRSDVKCVHDLFLAIRVNIMLRSGAWLEKFVSENGIEELVAPLQAPGGASIETCNEIISTLFVLANSSVCISALLKISECCPMLYSLYTSSPSSEIMLRSLKLLGILCRESAMAQEAVLNALSSTSQSLQSLVSKLQQNQSDIALQFAAIKFVNALMDTRDKKKRASICEDLQANGFLTLLEPFKTQADNAKAQSPRTSSMIAQVEIFFENYGEATKGDKLGALRLALGDALNANQISLTDNVTAGNQGENDVEAANPEQEQTDESSANLSVSENMTSTSELKQATESPKDPDMTREATAPSSDTKTEESRASSVIAASSPAYSSLDNIFSQLQQQTKNLDHQTNEKLTNLMQKLALTLSDETGASKAVDLLDKSFSSTQSPDDTKEPTAEAKANQEPDLLTRVGMALFPSLSESSSVTKPPLSGRPPLFSGFGDFSLPSLSATTPANSSVSRPSFTSFIGADSAASPWSRPTDSPAARGVKLSLPFFQSSRKGPGLGVTPASTTPPAPTLPRLDITPVVPPLEVKPLVMESDATDNSNAVQTLVTGTDISKFRKLLSMGAPREAVRAKMQQAGLSPNLLDEQQGFTPKASPKPVEKATPGSKDATGRVTGLDHNLLGQKLTSVAVKEPTIAPPQQGKSSRPDITKFKKLLSMGAPLAAVKAKMTQAGLDPALLDSPSPKISSPVPASSALAKAKVKDDSSYAKFFKLLSMGAPAAAVKAKMVQAGLNSELLDTPDAEMPTNRAPSASTPPPKAPSNPRALLTSRATPQSEPQTKVKDDPQYAKFFKLLSMGAPAESVKAKMQMAGLQPELLDTPDAPLKPASASDASASQPQVKVKDDPSYAKFFKLLSMGAPAESVKAKMRMAGLNPDFLDTPDASLPNANTPVEAADAAVKVKDDPAYAKFFKLLSMGAPTESVKAKMQMAGLKPELLDTPDADVSSGDNQAAAQPQQVKIKDDPAYAKFFKLLEMGAPAESVKAKMRMAARRAHLSIAIKPAIKAKTRSFYWQQLKAEAIKGTIWEELEKEHSNQSSQDLLTLTESELELLETEFPPPAACGPGTGTRRGVMSGLASPGPASPVTSPRIVFLIDRARSNNISIIVKQFRMTELVLKELITVPRLKQRLSALETKHQFPGLVRDLQTKINKIRVASNEIAQSSELKTILLVILQVGNKMNHGTARGGAKGFRLNDLTKLVQLKSVDKSVTLLHYVARMVRMKKRNVVRLGDSLASLIEEKEESDLFVKSMTVFVDEASKDVATLKKDLDETLRLMRDIMLRFDKSTDEEEASAPAPDAPLTSAALSGAGEFFSIIYEFTMSLTKADRENELKRIREEKRLKQQELRSATPRRNAVDRAPPTKFKGKAEGVSSSGTSNNPVTTTADDIVKAEAKPESSTPDNVTKTPETDAEKNKSPVSKLTSEVEPVASKPEETVEEKAVPEITGIPSAVLKIPGIIKASALPSVPASPLKKIVGTMPTGIPSPMKLKRTNSSASFTEKSSTPAIPFDAASLNEIKSKLKTKHATNNEPQVLRGLKPEVEADGDDHDNNNNEPSSPEKALSEAEPSTRIEPNGGLFNTQVMIRLLTAKLGAAIHYHIIPSTQLVTTNLTTTGLFGIGQNFSVAASGDVITLPTYSCK